MAATYNARVSALTPAASALAVNGTSVGAILSSRSPVQGLRAALATFRVPVIPREVDERIELLCTQLGMAPAAIWLPPPQDGAGGAAQAGQAQGQAQAPLVQQPADGQGPQVGGQAQQQANGQAQQAGDGQVPQAGANGLQPGQVPQPDGPAGVATAQAAALLGTLRPQSQDVALTPQGGVSGVPPPISSPARQFAGLLGMGGGASGVIPQSGTMVSTPGSGPSPLVAEQGAMLARLDSLFSLVRTLEPDLLALKQAAGLGGTSPGFVPPQSSPVQAGVAPAPPAAAPTPSVGFAPPAVVDVTDDERVPRNKKTLKRKRESAVASDPSSSDGEASEPAAPAPSLERIDKVCPFTPPI